MANFDIANKDIDSLSSEIIGVVANKDEDKFYDMCGRCESVFKGILEMHPEGMEQEEKRSVVNILRRLKDIVLQLINIKKNVFGIEKEEKKEPTSKEIASSLEQKVLSLNNNTHKRAA